MKKIVLLSILVALSSIVRSQAVFQKAITSLTLTAQSIVQTSDEGFLLGGYDTNNWALLLKTDSLGNILWTKSYGSSYTTLYLLQAGECVGGGYYIFGFGTDSLGTFFSLLKTDVNGNVLWTKIWSDIEPGYGYSKIRCTTDGGFLISQSFYAKMGALKLDANGNTLWYNSFSDDPNDQSPKCPSFNCFISNDGNMLFTGKRGGDILLVKTNSSGNMIWSSTIGSSDNYYHTYGITQTIDGGYVVCGFSHNYTGNLTYPFIMKVTSTGVLNWYHEVIASSATMFNEIYERPNGELVAIGRDDEDITIIVTFDSNGTCLTSSFFSNNFCLDYPHMCMTSDGGFAFTTQYYDQSSGLDALVFMKTDASENFSCGFNSFLLTDNPSQITPTVLNVPIYTHTLSATTYAAIGNGVSVNFNMSDYCILFGTNDQVANLNSISVFPSPISAGENIHLELKGVEASSVSIYDANGKMIRIIHGNVNSPLEIFTADLSAGIYFIRVTDADEELLGTSKFIVR